MHPTRILLPFFAIVTVLEMFGDMADITLLHYGCKPLIMLLLMAYILQHRSLMRQFASLRWLFIGTIFALAGDVFLMIHGIDLFAFGLASFLVMQVCYIISFLRSIREAGHRIQWQSKLIQIFLLALYGLAFLYVLQKPFASNAAIKPLWPAVIVYAISICSMGIAATLRGGAVSVTSFTWVVIGALLFIISDSAIALNKFLQPIALSTLLVMTTYAAAQYLIIVGMIKQYIKHKLM